LGDIGCICLEFFADSLYINVEEGKRGKGKGERKVFPLTIPLYPCCLNDCNLLKNMNIFSDSASHIIWHLPGYWTLLAQNITDPNLIGQMQKAFTHFVQSGQAWALLIGLGIGYMIRNLTSYG
jgi:hypothetical protein